MVNEEINTILIKINGIQNIIDKIDEKAIKEKIIALKDKKQLLNTVLKNPDLQKKYPNYLKLYKWFSSLPDLGATILSVLSVLLFILTVDNIFTNFVIVPVVAFAVGLITYCVLNKYSNDKIKSISYLKPFYDQLGSEPFDKSKVNSLIEELNKTITEETSKLNNHRLCQQILNKWHILQNKLLLNLSNDKYDEDLSIISKDLTQLDENIKEESPELKIYMKTKEN